MGGMDKERFLMGSETNTALLLLTSRRRFPRNADRVSEDSKGRDGGFRRRRTGLTAGRGGSRTSFPGNPSNGFSRFWKTSGRSGS